jgi:hypothetical protein
MYNSIYFLSTLLRNFPPPPQNSLYKIMVEHMITIDEPHTQSRMWDHWQLGMIVQSGASVRVILGEYRETSELQRNNATCIFRWKSPHWRDRVSYAVGRTSDIAFQLKPVLFTKRVKFDLRRSVDMSCHEELQSLTAMYIGNGGGWYGVPIVFLRRC